MLEVPQYTILFSNIKQYTVGLIESVIVRKCSPDIASRTVTGEFREPTIKTCLVPSLVAFRTNIEQSDILSSNSKAAP